MSFQRLPRFHRVKGVTRIELTARDQDILRAIHRYRFLRSHQIVKLITGSNQQVIRRLQKLYHHGYLDRPFCQLDYYQKAGSKSIVYGLTSRGVAYLRRAHGISFHASDSRLYNSDVKRLFLEHALMVSDIMFALEMECRKIGHMRLLTEDEIPLPADTRARRNPFRWAVKVSGEKELSVIPDRVFALEFEEKNERLLCMLEADRGTMPIHRPRLDLSSFERKLLAYEATWREKIHIARFGDKRLRVLAVTDSQERAQHLRDACVSLPTGHGIFLFSTREKISNALHTLIDPWTDAYGKATALAA